MNLLQKHMVSIFLLVHCFKSIEIKSIEKTCYIKVQKYLVSFIWWPTDWPIRAWLAAHPASYFDQEFDWYNFWSQLNLDMASIGKSSRRLPRAIEKTGLLICAMQIWLLCGSPGPGGVDLLDKIKGFLDHLLTAGHFYPDAIMDINLH